MFVGVTDPVPCSWRVPASRVPFARPGDSHAGGVDHYHPGLIGQLFDALATAIDKWGTETPR